MMDSRIESGPRAGTKPDDEPPLWFLIVSAALFFTVGLFVILPGIFWAIIWIFYGCSTAIQWLWGIAPWPWDGAL